MQQTCIRLVYTLCLCVIDYIMFVNEGPFLNVKFKSYLRKIKLLLLLLSLSLFYIFLFHYRCCDCRYFGNVYIL